MFDLSEIATLYKYSILNNDPLSTLITDSSVEVNESSNCSPLHQLN